MTKELPLSRGRVALVDDDDFDWLNQWKWFIVGPGYAGRLKRTAGTTASIYLHRFIMDAPADWRVDHINSDKLDNRRANLRLVSSRQNQQNRQVAAHSTSGYKGVCWHKRFAKWHVRITVNGHRLHLGYHADLETAARLYDAAARHFFGEYARLSYPHTPTSPAIADVLRQVLAARATTYPLLSEWGACEGTCALCQGGGE